MSAALAPSATAPDLRSYDRIVVAFSGGKDSVASLLTVLEAGVPPERIDVYHHDVDGAGPSFMDWPCTTAYCGAVTQALGVPLYLAWKEGSFLREMLRDGVPTAPICQTASKLDPLSAPKIDPHPAARSSGCGG